jgi:hypothetical protein
MILIVLNQSWVVTQFGWTEPMVLVNKNQTGTGRDFWNQNQVQNLTGTKPGLVLELKSELLKIIFWGKKSLEPGINWLLTAGFRLDLPRKPEPN